MECNQRRWTKGVNTFERVQNSELSEKITKIKLRKSQKIKLHVTSFEFISFWVIVVSFFLFICHKSHTTTCSGEGRCFASVCLQIRRKRENGRIMRNMQQQQQQEYRGSNPNHNHIIQGNPGQKKRSGLGHTQEFLSNIWHHVPTFGVGISSFFGRRRFRRKCTTLTVASFFSPVERDRSTFSNIINLNYGRPKHIPNARTLSKTKTSTSRASKT